MSKILVIDDDANVADALMDVLFQAGFVADALNDGATALERLTSGAYELAIVDVLLPRLSGFALVEQLRQRAETKDLPIVMMSGIYSSRNHREKVQKRYGVIEFFDKPVRPQELIDVARALCKSTADGEHGGRTVVVPANPDAMPESPPTGTDCKEGHNASPTTDWSSPSAVSPEEVGEQREVEHQARVDFKSSAFVLQGSLKRTPVARVLGRLWRQEATGALLLRKGKVKKIAYFDRGAPISIKSNLLSECLGRILVTERMISEEELEASVHRMRDQGGRQGEILVAMGALTARNLEWALERQFEEKLFDTFAWEGGEYRFSASAPLPEEVAFAPQSGTPALVLEGIRLNFDESRLRERMLPVLDVPIEKNPLLDELDLAALGLAEDERKIFANMRLPASTKELLERDDLPPLDTLRLLYSLIALELLHPALKRA